MALDIDFHIHSKYSGGTSPDMEIPLIAEQAELKGLDIVGTGDATHPLWLGHLKKTLTKEDDIYSVKGSKTKFLITAEVEDTNRVHHVVLLPDLDSAESFRDSIKHKSNDIDKDGRPHLFMSAPEIVDIANGVGAMVGPAHAFTPWTAVYKAFDSLKECYQDTLKHIRFLELGLSANTNMADCIKELEDLVFMSNSDCHSPWPHRLGREFNRVDCKPSFQGIKKAIEGKKFLLNVGLNPREGKYHETACTRCFLKFKPEDAERLKRRCPVCKGIIKRGVKERIGQLADYKQPKHPKGRPEYIQILPLAEIISLIIGVKSLYSKKVQERWKHLVDNLGTEIDILVSMDINKIAEFDSELAGLIKDFREGNVEYDAGGGGNYGRPVIGRRLKEKFYDDSQKTLSGF